MDHPGSSLFQNTDINVNKSQNNEEEEDLEDQKRRKEELQNLLVAKLDEFNYEDSTINSSTNISSASTDEAQNKYREAVTPNEQLQVLYEVRLRELTLLKDEYEKYKQEKGNEIEGMKSKLILAEAENHQIRVSLKNLENLLVEKTSLINELNNKVYLQEEQLKQYEQTIKNMQMEISTYQTTLNEMHIKNLTKTPLSNKLNNEEAQKVHQDQILKLETLLSEQTKLSEQYMKEVNTLREEIHQLVEVEMDDKKAINALTRNFDSAQKQCEELINIIEILTNENHHLQERLNSGFLENQGGSPGGQMEKLKKMLVDKAMHIDTLKLKLQNYEEVVKECLEYRQLKNDVLKKELQECDNREHTKALLLLKNELNNYGKMLEDKNKQIISLNSNNRELLEKMEVMISQTRNDIQNISHKYNLPQLEKMTEDLKNAQAQIKDLEDKLAKSEDRRQSLIQKLQKFDKNHVETEIQNLKLQHEKQQMDLKNQLKKLQNDFDGASVEIENLKKYSNELINENTRLKADLKNGKNDETLNLQNSEVISQLQQYKDKAKWLEEKIEEMRKVNVTTADEKRSFEYQLRDLQDELENSQKTIKAMEEDANRLSTLIKEKDNFISEQNEKYEECQKEIVEYKKQIQEKQEIITEMKQVMEELRDELQRKQSELKMCKENRKELENEILKVKSSMSEREEVVSTFQKEIAALSERKVEKETDLIVQAENSEKAVESLELLKIECKLREEIQQEYLTKLNEVEKKYRQMTKSSRDIQKQLDERTKSLQDKHREQLTAVITECAGKLKGIEEEKCELVESLQYLNGEYKKLQQQITAKENSFVKLIDAARLEAERNEEAWKKWSKQFFEKFINIEAVHKSYGDNLSCKMKKADAEVAAIEKSYNDKLRKYIKNFRK